MSTIKLDRYKCHKIVDAAKIYGVRTDHAVAKTKVYLTVETADGTRSEVEVSQDFHFKHLPAIGGYLVRYEDGYLSFSPAKAFEDGYTRIE